MKCIIPEISWHNRDPVLSVDIQKKENDEFYRLASGGTDTHVLIWYVTINELGSIKLEMACDLTRHQRAVNAVKWSPDGELLASGDDESVVFIWKQKTDIETNNIFDNVNEQDKETWITYKILRGHLEDVYDLSWSPDSQFLASGSVDNTAIIWDVHKGKHKTILRDHKGFVQGVAWDPLNEFIATLSTDRCFRTFSIQKEKINSRCTKCELPSSEEYVLFEKTMCVYHDDTLQTFFRRLCISPDGNLIITPAGITDYKDEEQILHTTYIYSRFTLNEPSIILPSTDQYTVAAKFCPLFFKLREHQDNCPPVIPLPYRMVFAIASRSSVFFYDTQQKVPFAFISDIHYTRLTDLSWSSDGKILIVSSTDGFCSIITFIGDELGEIYDKSIPLICTDNSKNENVVNGQELIEIENKSLSSNDNKSDVNELSSSSSIDLSPNNDIKTNDNINVDKILVIDKKFDEKLIFEKEIISTEEKFVSPEKNNLPVTPISIRRQPRCDSSSTEKQKILSNLDEKNDSKLKDSSKIIKKSSKKITPIAIRKQPRVLVPDPVDKTVIVDEAMDAWTINESLLGISKLSNDDDDDDLNDTKENDSKLKSENSQLTEDIHLVYEPDTLDELDISKPIIQESDNKNNKLLFEKQLSPKKNSIKTPRRVEFKTISTSKSKMNIS